MPTTLNAPGPKNAWVPLRVLVLTIVVMPGPESVDLIVMFVAVVFVTRISRCIKPVGVPTMLVLPTPGVSSSRLKMGVVPVMLVLTRTSAKILPPVLVPDSSRPAVPLTVLFGLSSG